MVAPLARQTLVEARDYQQSFTPYGTPCTERFDPATQQFEILKCEVEHLQKRLALLDSARESSEVKKQA